MSYNYVLEFTATCMCTCIYPFKKWASLKWKLCNLQQIKEIVWENN